MKKTMMTVAGWALVGSCLILSAQSSIGQAIKGRKSTSRAETFQSNSDAWSKDAPSRPGRTQFKAGELGLAFQQNSNSIRLASLFDLRERRELLATNGLPFFSLTLRHVPTKKEVRLTAESGWRATRLRKSVGGLELRWANPSEEDLAEIAVIANARLDERTSAIRWRLAVENRSANWTVWQVDFPQVGVTDLGEGASVFFPRGPGEEERNVWTRAFQYRGHYSDAWCSMQFLAAYRGGQKPTGLYVGLHDPFGGTKDIELNSDPATRRVQMSFHLPAPDMGKAGNKFVLSGEAVWQLLRGDWYDAAQIYKAWVVKRARWWPKVGQAGRDDTPLWMRELSAWAQTGGAPGDCVPRVQEFQKFLGIPVGFHWYNWHQIPFDNDYPHYLPAKTNFARGVAELGSANVFAMPYINGRLWDTLDRGSEDFEFSKVAQVAASKGDDGKPYVESYGSKETNGQPVRLAVMCPATRLWQDRVGSIVSQLLRDHGAHGVYIDQVAAARPTLCMDAAHGHPLGGGHWWTEGYWRMLDSIRRAMPPGRMLTTECNGEPYLRWFDGYLTWHWQHDGQVPAFPAIYGGAIQMFGRAYRGGTTKDVALRMKAGQQLVFGEQLGWIDPGVIKELANADFFRRAAQLRWRFRRYFCAGEMARPPKLEGELPKVKADWQWSGEWWVTTDAVLCGAWRIPKERRLVLLFANVSDQPVSADLRFDGKTYGIRARAVRREITKEIGSSTETRKLPVAFDERMEFLPRSVEAWEFSW